ncbi:MULTISPECIES: ProQ/FINO family protein [Cobetia]|uniref:ProQ/FINO family protein n=1 Tax=Cobetia TaxID=204286 RepID=UPI0020C6D6B9|nr:MULTISPECIES: ProQ/FINO family protein [Cobetia]MDI4659798.1 ProQ/FINO family protein [Cobetia sp. BMC6]
MDRLEALYSALEHEADTQRQQRDTERRARTALESENARLRDALAQLEQQAASAATADADAHQRALADAERALAAERREREQLAEQLAAARQTLQEQQAQLNAVNEALLARDAQLRELAEQASAPQPSPNVEAGLAAQQEAQAERLASERLNVSQPVAAAQTAAAADSSEAQAPQAQVPQEQEAHQQNEVTQGEAQQASRPEAAPSPHALLKQWYKRYPDTFFKGHTRPLKIGIHIELLENEPWDDKLVRRALAGYVHLPRYLKAVRAGTQRVDLSGQSVGAVTEDEARHARQQLDELTRQQKAREEQATDQRISHKLSELMTKHRP